MIRTFLLLLATFSFSYAQAEFESDYISVETKGEGPDIVLIHGFGCSPEVWSGFVDEFAPTNKLHLVSLAGHASEPPAEKVPESYLSTYRDEIARYITEEKLEKPAVIGHSMGGLLTMLVAAEKPEMPGRIIVVDALPFFSLLFSPFVTSEMAKPQAELAEKMLLEADQEQFEKQASSSISILVKDEANQKLLLGWSKQCDRATYAQCLRELITRDARTELEKIECPATVIYAYDEAGGAPESFLKTLYSTAFSELEGAELIMIPNSYHFIMWDQPEEFYASVRDALAE